MKGHLNGSSPTSEQNKEMNILCLENGSVAQIRSSGLAVRLDQESQRL